MSVPPVMLSLMGLSATIHGSNTAWSKRVIEPAVPISMEYVPGEDLRTVAENYGFQEKIDLVVQIGAGLVSAHSKEVVHRDLKPENIKVTNDNRAKILDFGLAKTVNADSVDQQGNIEGTLYYLSPEQIKEKSLDGRSDIYSVGVVLFYLFTKVMPIRGTSVQEIMQKHLKMSIIEVPTTINPEVPEEISRIVMNMLTKKQRKRLSELSELILDLSRMEQGQKKRTSI